MLTRVLHSIVDRFSIHNRTAKADRIRAIIEEADLKTVLFVGTHPVRLGKEMNLVEECVCESASFFVPTGLLDDEAVGRSDHANWDDYIAANGLQLPFRDNAFDLVVSNAVIEHVGWATEQKMFVEEQQRVGRHVVITTPNRWFPLELHHRKFFVHWRQSFSDQQSLYTRLLSLADFKQLLPPQATVAGSNWSPTFFAHIKGLPRRVATPKTSPQLERV